MKNTFKLLGIIALAAILFPFLGSCKSPPPVRPAISQTVINIQRSSTNLDTGDLYIYVDGQLVNGKNPVKKGSSYSHLVNNGVHYISVELRRRRWGFLPQNLTSEAINFTANNTTVPFVVTVEGETGVSGVLGNAKLVINRSVVIDDTGRETRMDIQEAYGKED